MRRASSVASRSPRPLCRTATLITNPPKTSQSAVEWKPENTTPAGATPASMAARKKAMAARCSAITPVVHSPMTKTASPAARITPGATPAGSGMRNRTAATASAASAMAPGRRGLRTANAA